MLLSGASLSLFMIGIESAGRGVLPVGVPWICVAVGLLLFRVTVLHCRRVPNPAIDFSLLSIPTFHAATVAGSLFRAGAGALPFLVPLTLQTGFGYSATASGLVTFASALGSFCMRPMTALALRRFSVRTVLCTGSVVFAAVLLVCSTMSQAWPAVAIFLLLLLGGLGRSLSFATMGALAFADVPKAAPRCRHLVPGHRAAVDEGDRRDGRGRHDPGDDARFRQRAHRALATRMRFHRDGARRAGLVADVRAALE